MLKYDPYADVQIPAQKTNYIKDSEYGSSMQERIPIVYNPLNYSTKERAAKAFHTALRKTVTIYGQDPDSECGIFTPKQSVDAGYGKVWTVWWEAGPYEWAIVASLEFMFNSNAGWFTEPYHSFDLTFTE